MRSKSRRDSYYTRGGCHYFATALNKRLGWPIYALVSYEGGIPWNIVHAWVVEPDTGRALDADGFHDQTQLVSRYAKKVDKELTTEVEHMTSKEVEKLMLGDVFSNISWQRGYRARYRSVVEDADKAAVVLLSDLGVSVKR